MGRYDSALGIGPAVQVKTALSVTGATEWAVGKAPALVGGTMAQWVYDWAIKKWPKHPRGADFVGGLAVVVAAYGFQVGMAKFMKDSTHLADKITDGMIGRASGILVHLFRGLFGAKQQAAQGTAPAAANASLDGDREAITEVGGLLQNSPETTQEMADAMYAIMRRDGHEVDENGRVALVRSMREVAQKFAAGNF